MSSLRPSAHIDSVVCQGPAALKARLLQADAIDMNMYEVLSMDGRFHEVAADSCDREADDWVFTAGETEVFRVARLDILSIGKVPPRRPGRSVAQSRP